MVDTRANVVFRKPKKNLEKRKRRTGSAETDKNVANKRAKVAQIVPLDMLAPTNVYEMTQTNATIDVPEKEGK